MNHMKKIIDGIGAVLVVVIYILLLTVCMFLVTLSAACTRSIDYISKRLGLGGEPLTSKIFNVDED